MQKFSNRLISLRKERSLTQEDLAKIIHKKRSTVSGYETEGKEPDLETVCFVTAARLSQISLKNTRPAVL